CTPRRIVYLVVLCLLAGSVPSATRIHAQSSAFAHADTILPSSPAAAVSTASHDLAYTPRLGTPPANFVPPPLRTTTALQRSLATATLNDPQPPQETLLSQGKHATASSQACYYDGSCSPPSYANDSKLYTSWVADHDEFTTTYPQWWQVDLGRVYTMTKVLASWYGDEGGAPQYQYEILVSASDPSFSDPQQYTRVVDKLNNTIGNDTEDTFTAQGRYLRIRIAGVDPAGYDQGILALSNVEVYGILTMPTDQNNPP